MVVVRYIMCDHAIHTTICMSVCSSCIHSVRIHIVCKRVHSLSGDKMVGIRV